VSPEELLVFEAGSVHLSVRLSLVEEVVRATMVTPVPNSPPFLLGVAAVRGRVMAVIDAARRYGISPGLGGYFLVCQVRGNPTAIVIDRPILAGQLPARALQEAELEAVRVRHGIDGKFVRAAFELFESAGEEGSLQSAGITCFEVDPDLFVSAEMASRVGEAA